MRINTSTKVEKIPSVKRKILKEKVKKKSNDSGYKPSVSSSKKALEIIVISDSEESQNFEFLKESDNMIKSEPPTSIPKQINNGSLEFPDIPVVYPSPEEFASPLKLIQRLYRQGYQKFGLVKVRPPKDWKSKFVFDNLNQKVNTRIQVLNDLTQGNPYEINYSAYTYSQFKNLADKFEQKFILKNPLKIEDRLRANEYEFWSYVENKPNYQNKVKVEYAADLPSKRYGSAFQTNDSASDDIYDASGHFFNLNHINDSENSLFQYANKFKISGIMSPWVYLGMLFSCFCWHVEDLYMYSINYMHVGNPKTWYAIPGDYKDQFEELMRKTYPNIFEDSPDILHQITLMLSPSEIKKSKIPIYRTDQHPGDYIITFPKVYHAGFSHGFNCAEAVNITIPEWIKYCKEAVSDYAKNGFLKKLSFPLEWLLIQNLFNLNNLKIDKASLDMIKKELEEMIRKELESRENVRKVYNSLDEVEFYNPRDKYDRHHCTLCKNYTYLSYLICTVCRKQACTSHITVCNCLNARIQLNFRFSDEVLNLLIV